MFASLLRTILHTVFPSPGRSLIYKGKTTQLWGCKYFKVSNVTSMLPLQKPRQGLIV